MATPQEKTRIADPPSGSLEGPEEEGRVPETQIGMKLATNPRIYCLFRKQLLTEKHKRSLEVASGWVGCSEHFLVHELLSAAIRCGVFARGNSACLLLSPADSYVIDEIRSDPLAASLSPNGTSRLGRKCSVGVDTVTGKEHFLSVPVELFGLWVVRKTARVSGEGSQQRKIGKEVIGLTFGMVTGGVPVLLVLFNLRVLPANPSAIVVVACAAFMNFMIPYNFLGPNCYGCILYLSRLLKILKALSAMIRIKVEDSPEKLWGGEVPFSRETQMIECDLAGPSDMKAKKEREMPFVDLSLTMNIIAWGLLRKWLEYFGFGFFVRMQVAFNILILSAVLFYSIVLGVQCNKQTVIMKNEILNQMIRKEHFVSSRVVQQKSLDSCSMDVEETEELGGGRGGESRPSVGMLKMLAPQFNAVALAATRNSAANVLGHSPKRAEKTESESEHDLNKFNGDGVSEATSKVEKEKQKKSLEEIVELVEMNDATDLLLNNQLSSLDNKDSSYPVSLLGIKLEPAVLVIIILQLLVTCGLLA
uniref:Uncharacterized protein n=1 Tax=Chromera velia CCMP2878 TaxID=1169474 RepID=A0A0G4I445_9ALVE|eukprot:Cvel_10823.t1-p1 / transcript=Cvel_10823.t1 / gene=Cvel_10823 / organism=Chromera_velia_CCMP2878 / gene_product=hypothetical protein / transcript_product=hypothetical protein / location=Cvel_scaffold662:24019-30328(+) / protein_length=532 / sequence_SO=supercontig / SO=protein_coding / is_pseudo=false